MNLTRFTLHNFGVYRGRHVVELSPPSRRRPVILVGGLNGGGKTTFLDALQLALYGRMAHASNRGDLAYEEYLRRTVSHGVDARDGAALEIEMSRLVDGRMEEISVRRAWSVREKHAREKLEVWRNGALDTFLTEGWAEHIEELMPVRLSRFFFFDGEKIESLADLDRSAEVLHTAIHVLLGLDLVDQLLADLGVLERRKRTEQKAAPERIELEKLKEDVDALEARREALVIDRGAAQVEVDRAQRLLLAAEERFKLGGGDAYAQRKELEARRADVEDRIRAAEDALREEAEGIAPLLLLGDLLAEVATGDEAERAAIEAQRLGALLAQRDAHVLAAAQEAGANRKVLAALDAHFAGDRKSREGRGKAPFPLGLGADARVALPGLRASLRADVPARLRIAVEQAERANAALDDVDRRLAGAPEADAIEALTKTRAAAKDGLLRAEVALGTIEADLAKVTREHEHKWDVYKRQLNKAIDVQGEAAAVGRILTYAERTRETMKRFRVAVLEKRVRRVEALVLEGFQHLLRKEGLITELRIDPQTFTMTLYGADHRELSPERLSAGERQLLAVSIIWALARASGRPLPVVIDTPLGRLDSVHREHLVDRYFPQASHQVILLSTDEEIDERWYERLKPHIGRSYLIRHDDQAGTSTIEPGYFFGRPS